MDHNQDRRRHFHRGRRAPDRHGQDRRTPPPQEQSGGGRDQVDVEQIMRDIRGRIVQRSGIELSTQQIQDLAARRLEAILDPRSIKPALLDELRKGAALRTTQAAAAENPDLSYSFEDTTLYESHRGVLRLIRRVLSPILKLFFNPNPLIRTLNTQARINADTLRREADRDRRQAEWNALHYEILQRLVTEVSRVTIELQSQTMRIESLAAKVDFNERRVRGIEGAMHQPRHSGRPAETVSAAAPQPAPASSPEAQSMVPAGSAEGQPSEASRRRRRRRRGRRGTGVPTDATRPPSAAPGVAPQDANVDAGGPDDVDAEGPDEGDDNGGGDEMNAADTMNAGPASEPVAAAPEPAGESPAPESSVPESPHAEVPAPEPPASEPFVPRPPSDPPESA